MQSGARRGAVVGGERCSLRVDAGVCLPHAQLHLPQITPAHASRGFRCRVRGAGAGSIRPAGYLCPPQWAIIPAIGIKHLPQGRHGSAPKSHSPDAPRGVPAPATRSSGKVRSSYCRARPRAVDTRKISGTVGGVGIKATRGVATARSISRTNSTLGTRARDPTSVAMS